MIEKQRQNSKKAVGCPVETLRVIGGQWKVLVLHYLKDNRFAVVLVLADRPRNAEGVQLQSPESPR